jgi:hypothetical protein
VQVEVPLVWIDVAEQDTLTDVIVGDGGLEFEPPPPPQPDNMTARERTASTTGEFFMKTALRIRIFE